MKRVTLSMVFLLLLSLVACFKPRSLKQYSYDEAVKSIKEEVLPVVIIGGGVAGLSAANYLLQARIPCLIIEGEKKGGALAQSHSVRNWPGVLDAPGGKITQSLKDQVLYHGGVITQEKIIAAYLNEWPYRFILQETTTQKTRTVYTASSIIAMGAEPNYLGVPGERGPDGYWGRGVTNCAVCDGDLYRNQAVAVIGGGDSAVVEALYLSAIASKVTVFVRKDKLRAKDAQKVAELKKRSNVTITFNTEVKEIIGDGKEVTHLKIVNNQTNITETFPVKGLFLAIGSRPNSSLFSGQLAIDRLGYILVDHAQKTSKKGIFAAGDICDPTYKQAITAAGEGCKAALEAVGFLENIGYTKPERIDIDQNKEEALRLEADQQPVQESADSFVIELSNTQAFYDLLEGQDLPIVLDIYATLCSDCQKLDPILERLATFFDRRVTFARINISEPGVHVEKLTSLLGSDPVKQVPTLIFINNRKEEARLSGLQAESVLKEKIEQLWLTD